MIQKEYLKDSKYFAEIYSGEYELDSSVKDEMSNVFEEVMSGLQFYARTDFLKKLYSTSFILLIRHESGGLAGFGNVDIRNIEGRNIFHILSIYTSPKHRMNNLMVKTWKMFINKLIIKNLFCIARPLYISACAINPYPVLSLSKGANVWPDFLNGTQPPKDIFKMAKALSKYYPIQYDNPFKVGITEEYAGINGKEKRLTSKDSNFDTEFYKIADPENMTLVLFIAKLRARDILRFIYTKR